MQKERDRHELDGALAEKISVRACMCYCVGACVCLGLVQPRLAVAWLWQLKSQLAEMALKLQSELGKTDSRKKEVCDCDGLPRGSTAMMVPTIDVGLRKTEARKGGRAAPSSRVAG